MEETRIFLHSNALLTSSREAVVRSRIMTLCHEFGYDLVHKVDEANFIIHMFKPTIIGSGFHPRKDALTGKWELCITSKKNLHKIAHNKGGVASWDSDSLFDHLPDIIERCHQLNLTNTNWDGVVEEEHKLPRYVNLGSIPMDWVDVLVRIQDDCIISSKQQQGLTRSLDLSKGHPTLLFSLFGDRDNHFTWKRVGSHAYVNPSKKVYMFLEEHDHPETTRNERCHLVVINICDKKPLKFSSNPRPTSDDISPPEVMSRTMILDKALFSKLQDKFQNEQIPDRYIPIPDTHDDHYKYWVPRAHAIRNSIQEPELSDISSFHQGHTLITSLDGSEHFSNEFRGLTGAHLVFDESGTQKEFSVCRNPDGSICTREVSHKHVQTPLDLAFELCYRKHPKGNSAHKFLDDVIRGKNKRVVIFRTGSDEKKARILKFELYEKIIAKFKEDLVFGSEDEEGGWKWIICGSEKHFRETALTEYNSKSTIVIHLDDIDVFAHSNVNSLLNKIEKQSSATNFKGTYITLIPSAWLSMISGPDSESNKKKMELIMTMLSLKNIILYNHLYVPPSTQEDLDNNDEEDQEHHQQMPADELELWKMLKSIPKTPEAAEDDFEKELFEFCNHVKEQYLIPE